MFPAQPLDKRLPLKTRVRGSGRTKRRAYPLSTFASQKKPLELKQMIDGKSSTLAWNRKSESLRITNADEGTG